MILTRIKRGATRSLLLVKHNLNSNLLRRPQLPRIPRLSWRTARAFLLNALVVRTIVLPIPLAAPASAEASLGDLADEPPTIVRLSSDATQALTFSNNDPMTLTVADATLQSITIGKSVVAEREEKARADAVRLAAVRQKTATQQKVASVVRTPIEPGSVRDLARQMTIARFGESQWAGMENLIQRESGFNPYAQNRYTGACGLPQALPCSKLPQGINTPPAGQIEWMLNYVAARYGTPNKAWTFWLARGWY